MCQMAGKEKKFFEKSFKHVQTSTSPVGCEVSVGKLDIDAVGQW